jgi:hypothetical protein
MKFFDDIAFPAELYERNGKFRGEIAEILELSAVIFDPILEEKSVKNDSKSNLPTELLPFLLANNKNDKVVYIDKSTTIQPGASVEVPKAKVQLEKSEKSKEELEQDEEEKKKKEEKSSNTLQIVLAVGAGALALCSTYFFAQRHGEVEFLEQFEKLLKEMNELLLSAQLWITERRQLELPIPRVILEDHEKLTQLYEILHRLSSKPEKVHSRRTFGLVGLCCVMIGGGVLPRSHRQFAYIGTAGLGMLLVEWVYRKGIYSSRAHQDSLRVLATRGQRLVASMKENHLQRLRMLMELDGKQDDF